MQLCSGGEPLHTSQKAGKGGDHHGDQQEQKIGNAESWGDGCDHRQHGKFRLGRPGIVVQDKQNRRGHHEKHGTAQANSPWSAPWWDLPPQGGQDCHSAEHVIGRKCHSGGKPPNTALERRRRTGRQQEQGPRPYPTVQRTSAGAAKEKIEIIPRSPDRERAAISRAKSNPHSQGGSPKA